MEKDAIDLVLEIKGHTEHLERKLQAELKYLRDERDTVVRTLTKVSNELDLARKAGNADLREAYDRLKREAEGAEQRHKDEMRASRAENNKLREAKNEAFRRLTNQNILLEKVASLQESNLHLLRERDAAQLERDRLIGEKMTDGGPCPSPTADVNPGSPEATTLRIDTDMSDPQPGKLLVVRLEESDAYDVRDNYTFEANPSQWVGFLVETPAVEEQGPWVVYDAEEDPTQGQVWRGLNCWECRLADVEAFKSKAEAQQAIVKFGLGNQGMRVVSLAEVKDISRTMKEGVK